LPDADGTTHRDWGPGPQSLGPLHLNAGGAGCDQWHEGAAEKACQEGSPLLVLPLEA